MEAAYDPKIYQQLHDFGVAKQCLQQHQDKVNILGDLICQYEMEEKVGISLLHKHFPLQPHERLIKTFTSHGFSLTAKPKADLHNLTPDLWKVSQNQNTGEWQYYPLEFVSVGDEVKKIQILAEDVMNNHNFLSAMAIKLGELKLTNIFGIALLYECSHHLEEGEIMMETTEHETRMNHCSPMFIRDLGSEMKTPTLWQFIAVS
ncbi:MAG: hypothetical protein AB4062_06845 [Crocosphaera sp.]